MTEHLPTKMDAQALRDYQKRWQAVAAAEAAEQRNASISFRWLQLNAIVRLSATLGIVPKEDIIAQTSVWHRWNQLRNLHLKHNRKE